METTLDRKKCFGSKCGRGHVEDIAFLYFPYWGAAVFLVDAWTTCGEDN